MYNNKEIIHIVILIIYCIFVFTTTLFTYLYTCSNSTNSFYLKRRYQMLLLITTLGVITIGPLDIYIMGFDCIEKFKYIFIKFNIYYITVVPCYISYSYRDFIIYLNYLDNNERKKNLKKICILIYISIIIYTIIIDLFYFYNFLNLNKIYYYPFYIITIIYDIIVHPLIIYLLYKIKNQIMYDYILTMLIISFNFGVFIILSNININDEKNSLYILFIIKDYWAPIAGMLNYISYLIIPLIYLMIKSPKSVDTEHNNNIIMKDNHYINLNNNDIKFINEYQNIKKKKFKNNHDFKKVYKEFYMNNIKNIEYKFIYKETVDNIKYRIENDNIDINIFDDLFNKIQNDVLIKIYENNLSSV